MKEYIRQMSNAFTWKFIALLFITQCFIKGIVFVIYTAGVFPLLKSLGIDAVQVQLYGALSMSPWTVKPLMGIISDLVAIMGYHKRFWMLMSVAVGVSGITVMTFGPTVPILIVTMVTMAHFEIAVCDLLMEGQYAELMRENPQTGSNIVTLANGFQQVGFIIAMGFMGPLADAQLFRVSHIIALALCCTPIVPLLLNFMPEKRRQNAPIVLLDTLRLRKQWKIVLVVILTGLSAPAMAAISALASKYLGLLFSVIVLGLACLGGIFAFEQSIIWRVVLYQVLTQVSRVSFGSALDFFFTADEACLPNGPQFSYNFYITTTGIARGVASVATVFVYQFLFSRWKYRNVLLFTTILSGVGGIFDFIIVSRWNLAWGISDRIFFLIGDDVIHSCVDILNWIPSSSIIGKVCPENMESSTYAFIAGISNFGSMVAVIGGALITEWAGVVSSGTECNWKPLPWLILFGHITLMLVVSIPACFLIPNVPQDADLLHAAEPINMQETALTPDTLSDFAALEYDEEL